MRVVDMSRVCRSCQWRRELLYADGHSSIQCVHPVNDTRTTRDITLLDKCPEGKDNEENKH